MDEELLLAAYSSMYSVGARAISLSLTNWSMMTIAFFYNLFPCLETLIIQGVECTVVNNPTMRFPFICPAHIRHLYLRSLTFIDVGPYAHAAEAIVAPGAELRTVEMRHLINGHVVSMTLYDQMYD